MCYCPFKLIVIKGKKLERNALFFVFLFFCFFGSLFVIIINKLQIYTTRDLLFNDKRFIV